MINTLNKDQKITPLVRNLKEQQIKSNKFLNKIAEDLSAEKTFDYSPKIGNENKIEDNKNNESNKNKKTNSLNKIRSGSNSKHNTTIKRNTKISIDAEADSKIKSGTSDKKHKTINQSNRIQIISKNKEISHNSPNYFHFNSGQYTDKKLNNIKTRSKYIQNLLNDMSLKKYKQSCMDIIKNDNVVKKLYEECGFEKTNYNYENFIQNNFFNKSLFMYKLEMLFLDESNFGKKNFKENFFKNEMIKYLKIYIDENIYKKQMNNLTDSFKEGFENIMNFDLYHD